MDCLNFKYWWGMDYLYNLFKRNNKMSKKTYKIKLIAGDWSGDGHEITEIFFIQSNLSFQDLKKAFQKGCELTEVNFDTEVARRYGDNGISVDIVAKLEKFGFDISKYSEDEKPTKKKMDTNRCRLLLSNLALDCSNWQS